MTPADHQTLARKLAYLHKNVDLLEPYKSMNITTLTTGPGNLLIVERLLQTAIESVIDSSRLIVALEDLRKSKDERDALVILEERGILPEDLGRRLLQAKGFRNILVHEYVDINPERMLENLQTGLADLRAFTVSIAKWMEGMKAGE